MKRTPAVLVLLLISPLCLHADDASKRAKIDELFGMLHMDNLMEQVRSSSERQVISMTHQMLGANMSPEVLTKADEFDKKVAELMRTQISWSSIEPQYAQIYMDAYTEAQIDDMLSFYKSPTGTVMLAKLPQITAQRVQIDQQMLNAIQPQINQLAADFMKQVDAIPTAAPKDSNKATKSTP